VWRGGRERGKGRERESAEVFISGLGVSRSGRAGNSSKRSETLTQKERTRRIRSLRKQGEEEWEERQGKRSQVSRCHGSVLEL